jgi:hypothetical protein
MKIKIYLKDPDTLYDSINESVDSLKLDLPEEELDAIKELRKEQYREIADDWFEYGEYVTLELDTDTREMRVIPLKELEN